MKKFFELSEAQQQEVKNRELQNLIALIAEEIVQVSGPSSLKNKVDTAFRLAKNSEEPAALYKAIHLYAGDELKLLASEAVEDATFDEEGNVIYEIA